jgi:hypothetical protein
MLQRTLDGSVLVGREAPRSTATRPLKARRHKETLRAERRLAAFVAALVLLAATFLALEASIALTGILGALTGS